MKVGTFIGVSVETMPNWLPCCAAVRQCAQMSVPSGPHGRSSSQEFGTRAAQCVAKKLMSSPFPSFLNDLLEVSKSRKRLVGVLMIITDLLQNGAKRRDVWTSNSGFACSSRIDPMISVQQRELPRGHLVWTAHLSCQSQESDSENNVPPLWAR